MSQETPEHPLPPRNNLIHNAAIFGAVATPLAMLLPPRKFDMRFLFLAGVFSLSTNQLAYEYTGQSIYNRFNTRASNSVNSVFSTSLPEKAQRTQELLRQHKEAEAAKKKNKEEEAAAAAAAESRIAEAAKKVWLGGESEDWKAERLEEHRRKLEEGQGLGNIIMEQIFDVISGKWKGTSSKTSSKDDKPPSNAA